MMQEAKLTNTNMQGVTSSNDYPDFRKQIEGLVGKQHDLSKVTFGGGLTEEQVNCLVRGLSEEKSSSLRCKLKRHISEPRSCDLPEICRAITGSYTKEEAEQWIAEYEAAMSEILETGDS